ncbi:MAG: NAD(P)-dependent oxidoreductase [Burkholderiales bacterium]|nr:NAD(P)-dependent oxidoreductase [Burkholderiales bacterium]
MTSVSHPRIGIVGLGIMGGAMARALLAAGHEVVGHDIDPRRMRDLKRAGGRPIAAVADLAQAADALITALPSAQALHQVTTMLAAVRPPRAGQVLLETSTLPLADKAQAARSLRAQGRVMLDAPISGTAHPRPQENWIMYLSGPAPACRQVREWVAAFTLEAPRVGPFGSGTKLKLAANHLVAILNVACAEMTAFARHMGLDPRVALRHMGHSPYIGTGLMRLRMPMMIARRYQPASMKVGIWQKDMQIIADMARAVDCPTPLLNASAGVYSAAMAMGLAQHDTAATAEVWAALPRPAPARRRPRATGAPGRARG